MNTHKTREQWLVIADKLERLQSRCNAGRGVDCVRTIVVYIRVGRVEEAKSVASNESDKLHNYPELRKYINDNVQQIDTVKDDLIYL